MHKRECPWIFSTISNSHSALLYNTQMQEWDHANTGKTRTQMKKVIQIIQFQTIDEVPKQRENYAEENKWH
jgi:hypothetical protein